jgi:hypothetical protein
LYETGIELFKKIQNNLVGFGYLGTIYLH